ncbi:MAG: trimeric intracellular cation channel family protein [Tissierellia bacterium]|nr:trimeric intracellular cation channel family protein [Tissierellia bacterium]
MPKYETMQFTLDLIGTIAFALSGALLGIRRSMDLFGIIVLGVVTAVGGGMLRDTMLGLTPPTALARPLFTLVAVLCSLILFLIFYGRGEMLHKNYIMVFEKILVIFDAFGLGAFTVVGMNVSELAGYGDRHFLMIFMGMITGIGGGIIRDVLAGIVPFVFIRHVYAAASFVGGLVYVLIVPYIGSSYAMVIGFVIIVTVRLLAAKNKWELPRVEMVEPDFTEGKE